LSKQDSRLVKAREHGQGQGSVPAQVASGHPFLFVEPCKQLRDRGRAEETSPDATRLDGVSQTRPLGMDERPLLGIAPRIHLRSHARHQADAQVTDVESPIVACFMELRERALEKRIQCVRRRLRLEVHAERPLENVRAELTHAIAGGRSPLGGRHRALECFVSSVGPEESEREIVLEGDVDLVRRHERGRTLEQARRREVVDPRERPAAGGGQPPPRSHRQRDVLRCPQLGAVETGLLEVVAEDLVQLDEPSPVFFEPSGETLV
jgi:hypothetical protein